jgi:hypothetical protein
MLYIVIYILYSHIRDMLQRSYIILIIGTALLISGVIISALWAESFTARFMRENTILSGVSIRPAALVNTTFQVTDTTRSVSLAIHVERINNNTFGTGNNGVGEEGQRQITNNTLRETVRNPSGLVMTSNEFTKQFFTTFKPDVTGKYTITVHNLGNISWHFNNDFYFLICCCNVRKWFSF